MRYRERERQRKRGKGRECETCNSFMQFGHISQRIPHGILHYLFSTIFVLTAESLTHSPGTPFSPRVCINLYTPQPQCGCTFGIFIQRASSFSHRLPPSATQWRFHFHLHSFISCAVIFQHGSIFHLPTACRTSFSFRRIRKWNVKVQSMTNCISIVNLYA